MTFGAIADMLGFPMKSLVCLWFELFLFDINDDNFNQGQSQNKQVYGRRKLRHNILVKIWTLGLN